MYKSAKRVSVGLTAVVALLFGILAAPASASDAPNDTTILGLLKGGEIATTPEHVFPLGEKSEDPTVCDKTGERSSIEADVSDTGYVDNVNLDFVQGSSGEKGVFLGIPYIVCVELDVQNPGNIEGQITDKDIQIDPGPVINVTVRVKNQNTGSVLFTCTTKADVGPLGGVFSEPKYYEDKDPGDWNLDLWNKDPFHVPAVAGCPLVAGLVNAGLGLPTNNANVHLKFLVYDMI